MKGDNYYGKPKSQKSCRIRLVNHYMFSIGLEVSMPADNALNASN